MENILKQLGIDFVKIGEQKSGYRNKSYPIYLKSGQIINLIYYKNEPEILGTVNRANLIGDFLSREGFPARKTYSSKPLIQLKNKLFSQIRYACLYEYLPGNTIPWEAYTSGIIKNVGGKMGKMHSILKNFNGSINEFPHEISIQKKNLEKMKNYFSRQDVQNALQNKLKIKTNFDFEKFFFVFQELEEEENQILHMDFVRGNILFENSEISGIIDFEKVSYGPRIFDIARTLAFLLVDCKFKQSSKVWKYFLYNGYCKRGQNPLPNTKYLYDLVTYFWLYDFYKFLKFNPYEFLNQNEHFLRTRDFMIKSTKLNLTIN